MVHLYCNQGGNQVATFGKLSRLHGDYIQQCRLVAEDLSLKMAVSFSSSRLFVVWSLHATSGQESYEDAEVPAGCPVDLCHVKDRLQFLKQMQN